MVILNTSYFDLAKKPYYIIPYFIGLELDIGEQFQKIRITICNWRDCFAALISIMCDIGYNCWMLDDVEKLRNFFEHEH